MPGPRTPAARPAAGFGRSATLLSAGIGIAGLLTYLFFSLASHNLDPTAYGEIVVLWSAVFVTISVLHRPVEQYLSRTVAERHASGGSAAHALRVAALLQGAVALLFAAVALAAREPLEDGLFSGQDLLYWVFVGSVILFGISFYARGVLAGAGHFRTLAALLVCESAVRAAVALAVAVGIEEGQDPIALGVVAAPLVSLLVVPLALSRRASAPAPAAPDPGGRAALIRGGAFAAGVFWIMVAEQTFLNAGPLLLRAFEDAAAAGFIFNVLMLARAPLLIFQGVATSLLPHLTRLRSGSEEGWRDSFATSVGHTLRAVAAFTLLVLVVVAAAGPTLMEIAFGSEFEYDRTGLLLVSVGMGFYLAATTLNQAALAQGRVRRAAGAWLACATIFLAWCLVPALDDPTRRVEVGFAVGAVVLCAGLWRVYRAAPSDADTPLGPGSAEEIEARLALADEAS